MFSIVDQYLDKQWGKETSIDFISPLPDEMLINIFSFLDAIELGKCSLVKKRWKILAEDQSLWKTPYPAPSTAFGREMWVKYFGDVGKEPPLTREIYKILESRCPITQGKKVKETHSLLLIPKAVNGIPLTLRYLEKLVNSPKEGNPTGYHLISVEFLSDENEEALSIDNNRWILMTNTIIPKSRNKSYDDQMNLLNNFIFDYRVPKVLEVAICILTKYVSSEKCLFHHVFTRCQEKFSDAQAVVGAFCPYPCGLKLCAPRNKFNHRTYGIAAVRNLET